MARVKSDKPTSKHIRDWGSADDCIRQIADLQMQITAVRQKAADDINKAKAELAEQVEELTDKIKLNTQSLEVFCEQRKEQFGKSRSRKLSFGTVGWRKSTSIKINKKTTLDLIREVFSRTRAATLIIVKQSVNKQALARLTDDDLVKVKARREVKDAFFVEPDIPRAVDYTE